MNGIVGKNTMMSQQQKEKEEQVTKRTYLQGHSLSSLNTVLPTKDIGHMITWSYAAGQLCGLFKMPPS